MPSRAELELRAAPLNINASSITNDSVLEQTVIAAEKAMTAQAGSATTLLPAASAVQAIAG